MSNATHASAVKAERLSIGQRLLVRVCGSTCWTVWAFVRATYRAGSLQSSWLHLFALDLDSLILVGEQAASDIRQVVHHDSARQV